MAAFLWWDERPVRDIENALRQKDHQQALTLVNAFLKEHPDHGQAFELKGRALAGLQRWDDASRLFEQVGVVTPAAERAWSLALLHQQRWSEAIPLLQHLHGLNPADSDVLHELVAAHGKLGNFDEAIRQADKLSQLPGNEARGNLMLGALQNNRSNFKQAIQSWQRVLELRPDADDLQVTPDEFFLALGKAYLNAGSPRDALPALEKSLSLRIAAETQTYLAEACEQTGDATRAVQLWKQAVQNDPKSVKAREGLARAALHSQRADEALEWLAPILEKPGYESSAAYLAQRTYTLLKDAAKADEWKQKADDLRKHEQRISFIEIGLQRNPQSFWSRAVRAHRFAGEGNREQAARLVAQLRQEAPGEPFIQQLLRHLEEGAPLPPLELVPMKTF